jgi:hypothetical protein
VIDYRDIGGGTDLTSEVSPNGMVPAGAVADPAKPGQGVNVVSQPGERAGGVWYSYNEQGEAFWATFLGEVSGNILETSLLGFSGPPLNQPWNPADVVPTVLGMVTITINSPASITFEYAINGNTGVLNLVPFAVEIEEEDSDTDGIADDEDNCPSVANADQTDSDGDGVGDTCVDVQADVDADGIGDNADNCPATANADQLDRDEDGIGNDCDTCPDDAGNDVDEDGFCGNVDACPESDRSENVVIDGCATGVGNPVLTDGCSVTDKINECAADAGNHGNFVSCVAHLTNDLKKDGLISGSDKGAIQSCAAQSSIP